jgi:hypothetical protein
MGNWEIETPVVRFVSCTPQWQVGDRPIGIGVSVSDVDRFTNGTVETEVSFGEGFSAGGSHGAGVILGFQSLETEFFYVQFGDVTAYSIARYEPGFGFQPLARAGSNSHINVHQWYRLEARLAGQKVELRIDGVRVLGALLPRRPLGDQVGLIAAGAAPVQFRHVSVATAPKVFMVMQFGQQFDHIWKRVVEKVVEEEGFWPIRVDQVFGPNPILQDIKRLIEEAQIIVGEITPSNANVFYEIGYADALKKPLVLLAQEGTKLPFDLSGARVVFYRDEIGGEETLAENLRNNLHSCRLFSGTDPTR